MIATTKPKGRGKANSTIEFERVILEIVAERSPITVRGVAYALFTRGLISSMNTNNTQKVSRVREQIETRLNLLAWDYARHIEQAEVKSMKSFHDAWNNRLGDRHAV